MNRMADNEKVLTDNSEKADDGANRRVEEAMVALHRAVAISQFYPNSNPVMREALESTFGALINIDDDTRFRYALPGEEGQQLRVTLTQTDGECAPELRIKNRDETGLVIDHKWATSMHIDITLPMAGYNVFEVSRGNYRNDCVFELLVEPIE